MKRLVKLYGTHIYCGSEVTTEYTMHIDDDGVEHFDSQRQVNLPASRPPFETIEEDK
jgi:hypothetical protein